VTFTAENVTEVPLVVSFKDDDGNVYTTLTRVEIGGVTPGSSTARGESPTIVVVAILVACAVVVGIVVFLSWRRRRSQTPPG